MFSVRLLNVPRVLLPCWRAAVQSQWASGTRHSGSIQGWWCHQWPPPPSEWANHGPGEIRQQNITQYSKLVCSKYVSGLQPTNCCHFIKWWSCVSLLIHVDVNMSQSWWTHEQMRLDSVDSVHLSELYIHITLYIKELLVCVWEREWGAKLLIQPTQILSNRWLNRTCLRQEAHRSCWLVNCPFKYHLRDWWGSVSVVRACWTVCC